MPDIELRHLRYLIAVAETGSITRAAQRLLMTQPALSRAMRALERAAGAELLVRGAHATGLTPAGSTLLAEAYEIVERTDAALIRARGARRGVETLVVTAHECDVLAAVAASRAFEAAHAGVRVEIGTRDWESPPQADELRAGKADVAFLRDCFDRRGLTVDPLLREPRRLVLPADHPLSGRERLTVSDLRDEPITYRPAMSAEEGEHWAGADTDRCSRRPGPRVRNSAEALAAVLLGRAVAFGYDTALRHSRVPRLRIRPVDGLSESRLDVGVPAHGAHPTATLFAEFVRERWPVETL